jgi:protein gp37
MENGIFIVQDELEIHPIALILPEMGHEEYQKFKEDILGNGVLEPIVLFQGKVIDGRHRYKASRELEIDIEARVWEGGMDPVEYVVSRNIHRRHLTSGQRSMAAAKASNWHVDEAKKRQQEAGVEHSDNLKKGNEVIPRLVETLPQAGTGNVNPINATGKFNQLVETLPQAGIGNINPTDTIEDKKTIVETFPQIQTPALEEKKPFASNANENKARTQAGKIFSVSGRSVSGAQVILEHGTDEEKQAVESGKSGISKLEKIARERKKNTPRPADKQTFNLTNDSIKWSKYSWNPVTGCNTGCGYCYARDMTVRFPDMYPNGFNPTFVSDKLDCPINTKLPETTDATMRTVFVCSMSDLFGDWVPQEWIDQVFTSCNKAPDWQYIFLTKNPKRLVSQNFPLNSWIGATVDCQERVKSTSDAFEEIKMIGKDFSTIKTFVSVEPMNEPIQFNGGLAFVDWIIIGGRSASSKMPAFQPKWEWVERLHNEARESNCSVFWKPNLTVRPNEYPVNVNYLYPKGIGASKGA